MPLTDTAVKNAKPTDKARKLADEKGLYLEVAPNGGKWWRLKYRVAGKEKRLSLGVYPEVGLKEAREKRDKARKLIAEGIDPSEQRKAKRIDEANKANNGFEAVAREWHTSRKVRWSDSYASSILAMFERHVFPVIGKRPVSELNPPEVLRVLRKIELRTVHTAHKAKERISEVMRYAIATGRAERDPCPDLRGALSPIVTQHFAAITDPKEVGAMLRAFDGFNGTLIVRCALMLAPLVFCRPGELRQAQWADISLEAGEWAYTVSKTKTDHLVPLSKQAISILEEIKELTGHSRYVFPSIRDYDRPMSDAAINAALRRMGYDTKTEITGHGFRAMARTILAEQLHQKPEVIEHQLAHKVPDALGAAYNRTRFIKERKEMMQLWADYLDKLKAGAEVIKLPFAA